MVKIAGVKKNWKKMIKGQIQGKWFWVWNYRELKIMGFELAGL